jgi:hypothetical protein
MKTLGENLLNFEKSVIKLGNHEQLHYIKPQIFAVDKIEFKL